MKSRKLFLADLDGTLLTDEKQVSPATYEALRAFTDAGNIFAICTGRGLDNALAIRKKLQLDFPNSYVIGYNGGNVYDPNTDTLLYRAEIPRYIVERTWDIADSFGIHIQTYNDEFIIVKDYDDTMTYYRRTIRTPVIVTDEPLRYLNPLPSKILCIELHDMEKFQRLREAFITELGDSITTMFSEFCYLEIIPADSGKGSGLIRLAEHLGIPTEDTIAAGDSENDISMIEAAGLGIAMCNGRDILKERADAVTDADNNHDGLAPFLMKAISDDV